MSEPLTKDDLYEGDVKNFQLNELKAYIHEVLIETISKAYFQIGDDILYGKWKNKRGKIVGLSIDERGVPIVEIEPIPKGTKRNVIMGLYKIWKSPLEVR